MGMWRKRNPHTQLVGMRNCAAALKRFVPQTVKHRATIWPNNSAPRYTHPRELKIYVHTKTCMLTFIAALFTTVKK